MAYVMYLSLALHDDAPATARGWLMDFDVEAYDGRGRVDLTDDRARAMRFTTLREAHETWMRTSASHPVRLTDGKPNRPLTAYHAEILDEREGLPLLLSAHQ